MARSFPIPPFPAPISTERLKVFPLAERKSLTTVDQILVSPKKEPAPISKEKSAVIQECAEAILEARSADATVMLIYGAHLLRNGAALILERMMEQGWITHFATNGAGTIHDWEYAWFGRSTESVEENVATGTFGTWDETGRNIHTALYSGSLTGEGYGRALGRFIMEDGVELPTPGELSRLISNEPGHPAAAARADLLLAMNAGFLAGGRCSLQHRWKEASILAQAFRHQIPLTVHPGIGYDIIANHPMFNGALIGRAAEMDFKLFGGSVEKLDGGVVLSVGSAIMGPQVFEKSLSCVNNLRLQASRPIVKNHSIYVVDLQDGGNWDWRTGEPPKSNPAYYLRFCKSFSRMGGRMQYLQCDNLTFVHQLYAALLRQG
ncbi:MAG TPA: hypothetical protein VK633_06790 [Verrucomicrobiae bacterium]|nr:hypothetical protein [Verrucomicrobiae bacterium]